MVRRIAAVGRYFGCLLVVWLAAAVGCASAPPRAPYPHESLLTVVAELKLYLNQDPYRQSPGRDLEGQNVFRVSLQRLDSLKGLTAADYGDVLAYARGECFERLGQWSEASDSFVAAAAAARSPLAETARQRADTAARMAQLVERSRFPHNLEGYLNGLDALQRRLRAWIDERPDFPYESFARAEYERAQGEAARLYFANRLVLPDAATAGLVRVRQLVDQNGESCRLYEHWLLAGGMYEALARDLADQADPRGQDFADVRKSWVSYIGQAREAYRRVAQADGQPAKLEGQARLRALDAYDLRLQTEAR